MASAYTGVLTVRVIRGKHLVARDTFVSGTSDPYVKLRLGEHEVRTRVVKRDVNPRWDEELTLATSEHPIPLQLFVYDKDKFTHDDPIGNADIDIYPLIAAAKRAGSSQCSQDNMIIEKIAATTENGFLSDSMIKFENGQIKQELCVKLKNVEKGQIELELRWQQFKQES